MPRFAANLTMLFNEVPFLDRFAAAAKAGFSYVEFLFPYDHAVEEVSARLRDAGLKQALFNMPPGDWGAGERGIAALPGREMEFRASIDTALTYARALDCPNLHAMAGVMPEGADPVAMESIYVENLRSAADTIGTEGRSLLIEPLNPFDMPGYFVRDTAQARRLIEVIDRPNVKLQLDLYHCQRTEGELAGHIRDLLDITGHIQIAGNPDRHEPTVGEINYPFLFDLLDDLGYAGVIGCEYRPKGSTTDGLAWAQPYGVVARL